jgi:hypothetical protein
MYDGFVAKLQRLKQRKAPEPTRSWSAVTAIGDFSM